MAAKIYIILGLITVFIIGFYRARRILILVIERLNFLSEYRDNFIRVANSISFTAGFGTHGHIDHDLYHWLTMNASKAQREVGVFGVGEFVAPFQIYKIRNYQFIVNTLPKLRQGLIHHQEITAVDDILVRCIGYYAEIEQRLQRNYKNPVKWFQYGVRFVISVPIRLLEWFGIINDATFDSITANAAFKVLSGIIALISFFSSIVTIFTGWEPFKAIVRSWWK